MFLNFQADRKPSVESKVPAVTAQRKISTRVPEEMSVLNPSRVLPRHNCINGALPTGLPPVNKVKEPEKKKISR